MKFKDVPKDKICKIADSVIAGLNDLGHDYNYCKRLRIPKTTKKRVDALIKTVEDEKRGVPALGLEKDE